MIRGAKLLGIAVVAVAAMTAVYLEGLSDGRVAKEPTLMSPAVVAQAAPIEPSIKAHENRDM